MPVRIEPTSVIKTKLGINPSGPVQKFFANTCAKAMDKYVPCDTGTLAETVIVNGTPTSNVTPTTITYETNYAIYVYNGINRGGKPMKYNYDKHPLATHHWDKKMWSAEKYSIIRQVQNYINRGGKNG